MKYTTIFLFLLISFAYKAQEKVVKHYDTLFYEGGMIRAVTIRFIDNKTIHFNGTTKKGVEIKSTASTNNLEYYVDYDSTGTVLVNASRQLFSESDTSKFTYVPVIDTILVPEHHLSISPFSIALVGINLDYMYRFGAEKTFALHVPFRVTTVFLNTFVFQTGMGINFIPFNSKKGSLYVGASAQYYFVEGYSIIGFPITMGFIRNITDLLTINAFGGIGPYIGDKSYFDVAIIPDFHFGLGFKFGEFFEIKNETRIKTGR